MSKKRRQPDVNGDASEGSTESSQESNTDKTCPHVSKALSLNSIKKCVKKTGIHAECSTCRKNKSSKNHADQAEASSLNIWICLQCGDQNCGTEKDGHSHQHYEKPHSDYHCVAINIQEWNIWCYKCVKEIVLDNRKKIEVVDFIKKFLSKSSVSQPPKMTVIKNQKEMSNVDKEKEKMFSNLPKIVGLQNLGNTCFFNAMLQCLAQTPYIVKVLDDLCAPGQKFILPGGKFKPTPDAEEIELAPIEGILEGTGNFTSILCKTLTEMQNCTSQHTFSPMELLNAFKKKAMQCMDGGQHDSHELLRHLLELVRNEDLRRYQSIIMKELGLSKKIIPETVENSVKAKVKFYGNQVNTKLLGPEPVFRGVLVSTLECMKCHHSSQCKEPFLDLSLPVTADKPQPPVLKRKNSGLDETFDLTGNSFSNTPSKHQLKKEKKAARKHRKNKSHNNENHNTSEILTKQNNIIEENGSVLESEESDADVEDNIEVENTFPEVGESGYSSEKASAIASPVSPGNHRIDNQSITSPEVPNVPIEKSLFFKPVDNLEFPQNHDTINVSALNSPSPSDVSMTDITQMRLSSEADRLESSESLENENVMHTGLSLSTSLVVNSDLTSPDALTVSPLSSSITSKDSPMSPLSSVPNGDEVEKVDRLLSRLDNTESSISLSKENSSTPTNETKNETVKLSHPQNEDLNPLHNRERIGNANSEREVCVGINDITSGLSRLGITNSIHHSPAKYPRKEEEYSIQSCLNQFTTLELMSGSNEVGCEKCTAAEKKVKVNSTKMVCTPHTKQYLISRVPAVLILHLKRFQAQRVTFRKVTRRVAFSPLLDLAPVCKGSGKPRVYALYGVVEHYGSTLHGGHYIAYVKTRMPLSPDDPRWSFLPAKDAKDVDEVSNNVNSELEEATAKVTNVVEPPPGKWYCVSDSRITEVDESTVLHSQAYLLFYERIL
ncbi:hypothetical protein KPH14_010311 [Odynerus spinipes]|uniref:Ubiquitin carboxyl-terminal hydrolase n=1 Tax=Odynerus spinipes TaxID=1348599 RepID=A0AAD9RTK9_9HYME|nr:hypothetical protein KPH14_010311 [Odynerus spinipes]